MLSEDVPSSSSNQTSVSASQNIKQQTEEKATTEEEKEISPHPEVANALSKITEKNTSIAASAASAASVASTLIPTAMPAAASVIIPESTKVISNLFGKLSKFTAMHQPLSDPGEAENDLEDPVEAAGGLNAKLKTAISTNVFYEDVLEASRRGRLHPSLETFGSGLNGPVDSTTLSLLSRYYRHCFDHDRSEAALEAIEWPILKDILQVILDEDTTLGLSFMLAHAKIENLDDFSDMFLSSGGDSIKAGLGLYLASLKSFSQSTVGKTVAASKQRGLGCGFQVPPGLLFCAVQTLPDDFFVKFSAKKQFLMNETEMEQSNEDIM